MIDELENLINPAARSNIRERALAKTLARVREVRSASLQVRDRGLSPLEKALNEQYTKLLRDADVRLADSLRTIKQQNAAEQAQEEDYRSATPLRQARIRQGLFRSGQDRSAAILGFLERERRAAAPLTRQQFVGAKAIAASRGGYDIKSAYRRGAVVPGVSGSFGPEHLRGVDIVQSDVDPCAEFVRKAVVRREVMFALAKAARGYRGSRGHSRSPC